MVVNNSANVLQCGDPKMIIMWGIVLVIGLLNVLALQAFDLPWLALNAFLQPASWRIWLLQEQMAYAF